MTIDSLLNTVHCSDVFDLCALLPDYSVNMILCDLPYGTTKASWDNVIPIEPMWDAFKRIIKPRGAIVLTASEPFTFTLGASNMQMFRHAWIWQKNKGSNYLSVNHAPLKTHEHILVFSKSGLDYYPQKSKALKKRPIQRGGRLSRSEVYSQEIKTEWCDDGTRYPTTVLYYPNEHVSTDNGHSKLHPTMKPVELFKYLIKTYTLPGQLVFDPCVGSGTTAVAAKSTGRNFIVGDLEPDYVEITKRRVFAEFGKAPKRNRSPDDISNLPLFNIDSLS